MGYSKGLHNGGNQRGKSYVLILLMTFGAALLGVMVLHRFRERRIYNLLVKEKDHQLLALHVLLQKEREHNKELNRKNEETKVKVYTLSSQKMELARTIAEMKSTMSSLKDEQKLIESAFEEKRYQLRMMMQEKGCNLVRAKDLKNRLETNDVSIGDHPTIFDKILAANETIEVQNKTLKDNQEKDESSKDGGDESKSKLTELKDEEVTAEIQDKIKTNEELGKKNEDPQDDDSAGATAKDIETGVVEEKKSIREERQRKLESNTDDGRQDFNAKQMSGLKRKQGHLSRTKGKRWRTIIKNKLMENNGIVENHGEVNIGNRKVYIDGKDGIVGRDSYEEEIRREDEGKDSNNQREVESHAKFLKPKNHENKEDEDGNNTTVDETNHQVTDNGINNNPEEHEDGLVQQNLSRRHINNAEQTKSNMFHEESEELEVSDVQKQEKDAIDDGDDGEEEDNNDGFFNESRPDFEDENEKEEYKEEIDESEFLHGL